MNKLANKITWIVLSTADLDFYFFKVESKITAWPSPSFNNLKKNSYLCISNYNKLLQLKNNLSLKLFYHNKLNIIIFCWKILLKMMLRKNKISKKWSLKLIFYLNKKDWFYYNYKLVHNKNIKNFLKLRRTYTKSFFFKKFLYWINNEFFISIKKKTLTNINICIPVYTRFLKNKIEIKEIIETIYKSEYSINIYEFWFFWNPSYLLYFDWNWINSFFIFFQNKIIVDCTSKNTLNYNYIFWLLSDNVELLIDLINTNLCLITDKKNAFFTQIFYLIIFYYFMLNNKTVFFVNSVFILSFYFLFINFWYTYIYFSEKKIFLLNVKDYYYYFNYSSSILYWTIAYFSIFFKTLLLPLKKVHYYKDMLYYKYKFFYKDLLINTYITKRLLNFFWKHLLVMSWYSNLKKFLAFEINSLSSAFYLLKKKNKNFSTVKNVFFFESNMFFFNENSFFLLAKKNILNISFLQWKFRFLNMTLNKLFFYVFLISQKFFLRENLTFINVILKKNRLFTFSGSLDLNMSFIINWFIKLDLFSFFIYSVFFSIASFFLTSYNNGFIWGNNFFFILKKRQIINFFESLVLKKVFVFDKWFNLVNNFSFFFWKKWFFQAEMFTITFTSIIFSFTNRPLKNLSRIHFYEQISLFYELLYSEVELAQNWYALNWISEYKLNKLTKFLKKILHNDYTPRDEISELTIFQEIGVYFRWHFELELLSYTWKIIRWWYFGSSTSTIRENLILKKLDLIHIFSKQEKYLAKVSWPSKFWKLKIWTKNYSTLNRLKWKDWIDIIRLRLTFLLSIFWDAYWVRWHQIDYLFSFSRKFNLGHQNIISHFFETIMAWRFYTYIYFTRGKIEWQMTNLNFFPLQKIFLKVSSNDSSPFFSKFVSDYFMFKHFFYSYLFDDYLKNKWLIKKCVKLKFFYKHIYYSFYFKYSSFVLPSTLTMNDFVFFTYKCTNLKLEFNSFSFLEFNSFSFIFNHKKINENFSFFITLSQKINNYYFRTYLIDSLEICNYLNERFSKDNFTQVLWFFFLWKTSYIPFNYIIQIIKNYIESNIANFLAEFFYEHFEIFVNESEKKKSIKLKHRINNQSVHSNTNYYSFTVNRFFFNSYFKKSLTTKINRKKTAEFYFLLQDFFYYVEYKFVFSKFKNSFFHFFFTKIIEFPQFWILTIDQFLSCFFLATQNIFIDFLTQKQYCKNFINKCVSWFYFLLLNNFENNNPTINFKLGLFYDIYHEFLGKSKIYFFKLIKYYLWNLF